MQAKRRPTKAVYGRGRHTKLSDVLWDEAISAPDNVALVMTVQAPTAPLQILTDPSAENKSSLSDHKEVRKSVLSPNDPNISPLRRPSTSGKKLIAEKKSKKIDSLAAYIAVPIAESAETDLSLLEPPDSPPALQDGPPPFLTSTPIDQAPVRMPWLTNTARSHIRYNTSSPEVSDKKGETRSSDSASDTGSEDDSSELTSIRANDDLQDLTRAFDNLLKSDATADTTLGETSIADEEQLQDYKTLLHLCDQSEASDISEHFAEISSLLTMAKLGEASFSEVYLGRCAETKEETVFKVIPFGDAEDEVPINDIVQEVRISRAMSDIRGYVKVKSVSITQGLYPADLLDLWDEWQLKNGSESDRPDRYTSDQRYCIIALEHGGVDLEHYEMQSWQEAWQLFLEITQTLANGENARQFEHRDLHWGNVLVGRPRDDTADRVTIIDYTLSRALVKDDLSDVAFYGFSDRAIFEAEGDDYQFEIYRIMRDAVAEDTEDTASEDWVQFHPTTNVLWLHYLVDKLLYAKDLKKPAQRKTKKTPTIDVDEVEAWKALDSTWKLLDPTRRYKHNERAIDSAAKVHELINAV